MLTSSRARVVRRPRIQGLLRAAATIASVSIVSVMIVPTSALATDVPVVLVATPVHATDATAILIAPAQADAGPELFLTPAHVTGAAASTSLHVNVQPGLGSMSVCVSGTASVYGDFEVSIEGVRSNGTRISDSASGLNRTSWTPACRVVYKLGTSYGVFAITFTFRSGLVSADDDVADGAGGWASGFNDLTIGSGG